MHRRNFVSHALSLGLASVAAATSREGRAAAVEPLIILESATTRRFFDSNLGKYDLILNAWRDFAARNKLSVSVLSTDQLRSLKPGAVAVLPSTVALSDKERVDLETALARGVSVLATWAFAPRDATGKWLGYGYMKSLFEAEVLSDIKPDSDERFLQAYGETPITHSLVPTKRVYLGKAAEPLLRAVATNAAARYSDWSRSTHKDSVGQCAAAYSEKKGSRRVWLGFPESSWDTARSDTDLMLLDSLAWLSKRPAAVISNWPAPFQSAFLLEMDSEDKFPNALFFADELSKRSMRGTFYCLTEQAIKYPDLVKSIASRHEIGYHADVHVGFRGQEAGVQMVRLQKMMQELGRLLPDPKAPTGFRAPLEEADVTTEVLLRSLGFRHHATSLDFAEAALPLFSKTEANLSKEEALVLLPRTMLDDVNFFRMGMLEKSVSGLLINSAKSVIDSHSFGLLSLHTQNYGKESALFRDVPMLLDMLSSLKDSVWVAQGNQIEKWWREKHRLSVTVVPTGARLDIKLTVNPPGQVKNAQMILMAPAANQVPRIQSSTPTTLQRLDEQRHALVFPELKAGLHSIKVSFS
jgi:Polysaccharide deacetylase